jgi:uncharacterized coiled-coil protein SlyX
MASTDPGGFFPVPRGEPVPEGAEPQAMLNRKVENLQATVGEQQKQITALLKERCKDAEQQGTITDLKSIVAQQQKQIEALTAGLQKVSAQIEVSKPAPRTVCLPAVALREGGNNQ